MITTTLVSLAFLNLRFESGKAANVVHLNQPTGLESWNHSLMQGLTQSNLETSPILGAGCSESKWRNQ